MVVQVGMYTCEQIILLVKVPSERNADVSVSERIAV